jgi:type II secretory pathway component PulK
VAQQLAQERALDHRQPGVSLMGDRRRNRGVVLLVVLFFALLLTGGIAAFLRRSTVDVLIARNRDAAAQAEALARGGVALAGALLLQDHLTEQALGVPGDSHLDPWWRIRDVDIPLGAGTVRLTIEDSGARLNLNALFESQGDLGGFAAKPSSEPFLIALLEKVIEEMPGEPADKVFYEPRELAANLIDFIDTDSERIQGGPEDRWYQDQDPPYRAWNQPLVSVEQLGEVEGFDRPLVDALRPYLTVYPFAPGGCGGQAVGCGINLNTAPAHVLAALFYDDGVSQRLATEEVVRPLANQQGSRRTVCLPGQSPELCTPITEIVVNPIFPPPTWSARIFSVVSTGQVGEIRRTVEATLDRSQPPELRLLSWRVR